MKQLELLAPARDAEIGIAAIDCGADAVYIAGPQFGARQAAGNDIDQIRILCNHAKRFGARVFVTLNTILYDDELEAAYRQMLQVQEAGADAIIVQDMAIIEMSGKGIGNIREDFRIPLHASTQCAIRTPEHARFLESLGFSRLILERELSLGQIRAIRNAVSCELEFFVHGALCVCYSGQCYLSEHIAGRSANRGACIQACRSRYDLVDSNGKVLVKDKALLSLKDYNLHDRLEELAEAGITSFKIEGRLKNISYVRNVVRYHSTELDRIAAAHPEKYVRSSFGKVTTGFTPDPYKTFNRGYTELFIDGRRGRWAAMDAAKSMGEEVGEISAISKDRAMLTVRLKNSSIVLNNGDGFSFIDRKGDITGFRGDVCNGNTIRCKPLQSISVGVRLFRNINFSFEKEMERQCSAREISVQTNLEFTCSGDSWTIKAEAHSEDGRNVSHIFQSDMDRADNPERMKDIICSQMGKTTGIFRFSVISITARCGLPFMKASVINSIRRELAGKLESIPCKKRDILCRKPVYRAEAELPEKDVTYKTNISNNLSKGTYIRSAAGSIEKAFELDHQKNAELMRSKYCIRYELGICPVHHHVKDSGPLFLLNNGRRLALHFDCRNCEMTVTQS